MEYLDELLELRAELEELLDQEAMVLSNDFMPGFVKNVKLRKLEEKENEIRNRLSTLEKLADESYKQKVKRLENKDSKIVVGIRM